MTLLKTQSLAIGYRRPQHIVAHDLNLSLASGELVCLLGPNGAGKSTLMRTIAGMQPPLAGKVMIHQQNIHRLTPLQRAKTLAIVLTERQTPAMLTGEAAVSLGRHPHTDFTGRFSSHDQAVVEWAIAAVNGQHLASKQLIAMSDGERQKMMIARALAQEPTIMLLDEPTAFLDLPRRVEMMHLLRQLATAQQRSVLVSTHDLELALRNASQLWLMDEDGVIRTGTPEDLVLNGAFQHTFASSGLRFDIQTGTFQAQRPHIGVVNLQGEGIRTIWTTRALERVGFESNATAPTRVIVGDEYWQVMNGQHTIEVSSIDELLSVLIRQQKQNATHEIHSTDSSR